MGRYVDLLTFWVDSGLVPETWGVAMPTHHPSMAEPASDWNKLDTGTVTSACEARLPVCFCLATTPHRQPLRALPAANRGWRISRFGILRGEFFDPPPLPRLPNGLAIFCGQGTVFKNLLLAYLGQLIEH